PLDPSYMAPASPCGPRRSIALHSALAARPGPLDPPRRNFPLHWRSRVRAPQPSPRRSPEARRSPKSPALCLSESRFRSATRIIPSMFGRAHIAALAILALPPAVAAAPSSSRLAVVVGSNSGLATDPPPRYAERDARRVAEAPRDVGGVARADP